jgi:hypothetical protein
VKVTGAAVGLSSDTVTPDVQESVNVTLGVVGSCAPQLAGEDAVASVVSPTDTVIVRLAPPA